MIPLKSVYVLPEIEETNKENRSDEIIRRKMKGKNKRVGSGAAGEEGIELFRGITFPLQTTGCTFKKRGIIAMLIFCTD